MSMPAMSALYWAAMAAIFSGLPNVLLVGFGFGFDAFDQ